MQVRDVMTQPANVINPSMTIRAAARQMRGDNIGALPVGENDRRSVSEAGKVALSGISEPTDTSRRPGVA